MSANTLLISTEMLTQRSALHSNVDPKLVYGDIKVAQDMYILPILGTGLYEKLQQLVAANTIGQPANADYKTLLDSYIVDALVNYTLMMLPMGLSYQFYNKGVVRQSADFTELPGMTELLQISDRYQQRAEWYAERLRKYLKQTATQQKLPEYYQPGTGIDTIHPQNQTFTAPMWLGDTCGCKGSWDIPNTKDPDKNCC